MKERWDDNFVFPFFYCIFAPKGNVTMEQEQWKPVLGYEGHYEVSNLGNTKSLKNGSEIILKAWIDNVSYPTVGLYKNGKPKHIRIHRLVWEAFNGKIPEGMEIDHINTIRSDCRLSNLRCVTHKENCNNQTTKMNRYIMIETTDFRENVAKAAKERSQDQEWQKKHAEGIKKRSQDQEWQRNTAEANRRKAQDPEWRRKVNEGIKNKYNDKEFRKLASDRLKKQMQNEDFRKRQAEAVNKPVIQYDKEGNFEADYPSVKEASRQTGVDNSSISACCKGKLKSAGGKKWKYKDIA